MIHKGGLLTEKCLQPPRYKADWRSICAILPAYLPDGTNGTVITYLDGTTEEVPSRLCWVLDDLLYHLQSSTAVLTRQSRTVLGKGARRVPLVLKRAFSLVPVKGRAAIGPYDSQTGYVVLNHVQKLVSDADGAWVWFGDTTAVHVLDASCTLWQNLQLAETIQQNADA